MSSLRVFVCLVAVASAMSIQTADVKQEADFPVETQCLVPDVVPGSITMAVASDETLDTDDKTADAAPTGADAIYKAALKEYRQKKKQYTLATAEVMTAIDSLLKVPTVDAAGLKAIANREGDKRKDTLVVFYAPWCPHCQTFVMHDVRGNPLGAPLEMLRSDLKADKATENVEVVRADITKVGKDIPKAFKVMGIPAVYLVNTMGEATLFRGDSHNTDEVKTFIKEYQQERGTAADGEVAEESDSDSNLIETKEPAAVEANPQTSDGFAAIEQETAMVTTDKIQWEHGLPGLR